MAVGKSLNYSTFHYSGDTIRQSKVQQSAYEAHRKKIEEMMPSIDNKPPDTLIKNRNDAKRMAVVKERQDRIAAENKVLIQKLEKIMNRPPDRSMTLQLPKVRTRNPYEEKREFTLKKIEQQNKKMVQRITEISKKSVYDKNEMISERKKTEIFAKRLAHYQH